MGEIMERFDAGIGRFEAKTDQLCKEKKGRQWESSVINLQIFLIRLD